jgi:hypothetical protein
MTHEVVYLNWHNAYVHICIYEEFLVERTSSKYVFTQFIMPYIVTFALYLSIIQPGKYVFTQFIMPYIITFALYLSIIQPG